MFVFLLKVGKKKLRPQKSWFLLILKISAPIFNIFFRSSKNFHNILKMRVGEIFSFVNLPQFEIKNVRNFWLQIVANLLKTKRFPPPHFLNILEIFTWANENIKNRCRNLQKLTKPNFFADLIFISLPLTKLEASKKY